MPEEDIFPLRKYYHEQLELKNKPLDWTANTSDFIKDEAEGQGLGVKEYADSLPSSEGLTYQVMDYNSYARRPEYGFPWGLNAEGQLILLRPSEEANLAEFTNFYKIERKYYPLMSALTCFIEHPKHPGSNKDPQKTYSKAVWDKLKQTMDEDEEARSFFNLLCNLLAVSEGYLKYQYSSLELYTTLWGKIDLAAFANGDIETVRKYLSFSFEDKAETFILVHLLETLEAESFDEFNADRIPLLAGDKVKERFDDMFASLFTEPFFSRILTFQEFTEEIKECVEEAALRAEDVHTWLSAGGDAKKARRRALKLEFDEMDDIIGAMLLDHPYDDNLALSKEAIKQAAWCEHMVRTGGDEVPAAIASVYGSLPAQYSTLLLRQGSSPHLYARALTISESN